ncbi:hypothetical protein PAP_00705 [Palaeococcus pacificus DY20341]|uniref:DUF2341 domain-containing protein n=1 Tax=Palaeococcus pacificus DY20341 TaxID=1343739 RepID=A0A075LQL7_9EURY|nr:DUF2341 domain-containing protein [Palaeococcus pacificus]AIF68584.1 hypothetical protein PAP_00705 [Palaeococcus pacificus DY20341]
MRRRGFLLNSLVLVLLIPLLLLLATYEDVSSQIVQAQSERTQVERSYRTISYLDLDFQKALEISGKRAIVAVVDYVSVTGNFITSKMANETIKDLILTGSSPAISGYDVNRIMQGQTIQKWLTNISQDLREQGFEISPNVSVIANSMELTVAPLDSFRIVIKARIPNITITDMSGKIVYSGSIPKSGNYTYSIVDIRNLEDPIFSAITGGRYYRSIKACDYTFPELIEKPIKVLAGNGSSSESHVIEKLSKGVDTDKIHFGDVYPGDGAKGYVLLNGSINITAPIIVNTTLSGVRTSPRDVFNEGDMGVMVFDNINGGSGWCSLLKYRLNMTIQNNMAQDLTNFQVPITIDSTTLPNPTLTTFFNTADNDDDNVPVIEIYDENCNPVNFWVESWDTTNKQALIWVNITIPANSQIKLSIQFDSSGTETLGNPNEVFDFYDDFNEITLNSTKWEQYNAQVSLINGVLRITNDYAGIYTKKTFTPPVIIEFYQNIKNSWAELYIAVRQTSYPWGPLWWVRSNQVQPGEWSYLDDYAWGNYHNEYPNLPAGWHKGTIYWFTYNSRLEWDTGAIIYNTYNAYQNYNGAIALGTWDKNQEWDWIRVRKYASTSPTVSISNQIEQKPAPTIQTTTARVYDIQPFRECINEQEGDIMYFGLSSGWSFFERLEGSNTNHDAYVNLAHQMQDELGVKFGNQYYPIGLVSFMVPHKPYDEKLSNLFDTLGIVPEEGQSSVDYYFLNYYFKGGSKTSGYRVWGISYGNASSGDLSSIPFFLDNQTAVALFGTQGAQDLLNTG